MKIGTHDGMGPWGWTSHEEKCWRRLVERGELPEGSWPARVVGASREVFRVVGQQGEGLARVAGSLRRRNRLPVVGDWVAASGALDGTILVHHVLDARSRIARKEAGTRSAAQLVATNVDTLFLVMGLDGDFNLRRIERFVALARECSIDGVVVLSKRDLLPSEEALERRLQVGDCAPGLPVFPTSAATGEGLEPLRFYLREGSTIALLGSSGAGKSTLLNALAGDPSLMRTAAVRSSDDRGRHTTTHRELVRLPAAAGGALLIDNPGIRELQLWGTDPGALDAAFPEIDSLAKSCRFRDCAHQGEPGCAVSEAVEAGELSASRFENYRKLLREQEFQALRVDDAARRLKERQQGAFYRSVMQEKKQRTGRR